MAETTVGRRQFMKLGLAGVATAAVGVGMGGGKIPLSAITTLPAAAGPASAGHGSTESAGAHRWAMVIDESKCSGCNACLNACRAYNDVAPDKSWSRVETTVDASGEHPSGPCPACTAKTRHAWRFARSGPATGATTASS